MEYAKIGTRCNIISGYAFKSSDWKREGIPVIKIGNISNGEDVIVDEQTQYVDESFYIAIDSKYQIKKGDILISLTGSHINQPNSMVGRCCRNYDGRVFLLNQRAGKIMPLELADGSYLYYLFATKAIKYDIANRAYGGANQVNISPKDIMNIKWNFPNIDTQRKIANILSAYDNLIKNNNRRIRILEQMAENLYKEWFVRFRFPGHETAEFENGLPKGWNYVKLGDYANISTGRCNREDAEDDGIYPLFDRSQETKKSSTWLKDCEAIIVPGEGTSFIPRYFCGKFNLHQRCYCVEPKQCQMGKFLFHTTMLNRIYFSYVATGATVPSLRQNNFTNMKILMPDIKLVKKFDAIVSIFMNQQNTLKKRNANLIKQRDMLLLRLMSDCLEVKND
ncbi:MAG: restriction endonuclease subunit S [Lentisphaeria bacterium]|nr:restriction endonuclease subunit S [Lentisphaeria bacterium]